MSHRLSGDRRPGSLIRLREDGLLIVAAVLMVALTTFGMVGISVKLLQGNINSCLQDFAGCSATEHPFAATPTAAFTR